MSRAIILFALLAGCLAGCLGTDAGNPPFEPEDVGDPAVAVDGVTSNMVCPPGIMCVPGERDRIEILIPADAIAAAAESVTLTVLDDVEPPLELTPETEGFSGVVFAGTGDVLRIVVTTAEGRLPPVDVVVLSNRSLSPHEPDFRDCLLFEAREYEVGSQPGLVRVRNECEGNISLSLAPLRLGSEAFGVELLQPSLGEGHETMIEVVLTGASGPMEDTLFVEVSGVVTGRQAITLRQVP